MSSNKIMDINSHFKEIRNRIFFVLIFFIPVFCICYYFSPNLYEFLLRPLADIEGKNPEFTLIYTGMTETFFVYLKVGALASSFIILPVFVWQIYLFIAPGLYKNEKKFILPYLVATYILFLLGAGMVYYFIFPMAWEFFLSFESEDIAGISLEFMPSVSEYLDTVTQLMFAFGIAFQLPTVVTLLTQVGLVAPEVFVKKRKVVIVLIFIVAAFLTPPDVFSQVGLAIPMLLLYELAVLASFYIYKSKNR